jgi:hypothetical protein
MHHQQLFKRRTKVPAILLKIQWQHSTEYIPLELSNLPSSSAIETYEVWKENDERIVYRANCEIEPASTGFTVRLGYSYEDNRELSDAHGVDLGESEINITSDLEKASAKWVSDTDPVGSSGKAKRCEIIDAGASDTERTTEWYSAEFIARPGQALLRKTLLMVDGCCALTGEAVPMVLDAAHINRVADKGIDAYSNSILLRTDLHRLYDGRAFALDNEGKVRIDVPLSPYYTDLLQGARLCPRIFTRIERSLQIRNAADAARAS